MPKIPFSRQILPIDYLSSAQADIKAGKPVSGDALLGAIEQSIQQQLPDAVREIVSRALIPAVKTRGRPTKFGASLDLALDRVHARYPALLRYEQRNKDRGNGVSKGSSSLRPTKMPTMPRNCSRQLPAGFYSSPGILRRYWPRNLEVLSMVPLSGRY
jgi:hypothetical protein